MLGAQKLLRIFCCIPTVAWDDSCTVCRIASLTKQQYAPPVNNILLIFWPVWNSSYVRQGRVCVLTLFQHKKKRGHVLSPLCCKIKLEPAEILNRPNFVSSVGRVPVVHIGSKRYPKDIQKIPKRYPKDTQNISWTKYMGVGYSDEEPDHPAVGVQQKFPRIF